MIFLQVGKNIILASFNYIQWSLIPVEIYVQILCTQKVKKINFEAKFSWKAWVPHDFYHSDLKYS